MGHLLDGILRLPPPLVLALVFLFPAVEASVFVGVLVPGEIGIVLGGVLANQHKLALWAVLLAAIAGAIMGDSVGYWVGKRYGEWILRRLPNRIIDEDKIQRAEQTVRRYGGRAVFVGRFTAALRALVPGTAGMSQVRYGKFLAWNVAGGTIWATAYVLIGYLAGSQYQRIEKYANYIGVVVLLIIAAVLILRRRAATRQHRSSET
ncbi:MAG TPA: DedA family protein [Jatrophihabitans sp.]|nr:DedA family protein [Jatrophihabitans sp.]